KGNKTTKTVLNILNQSIYPPRTTKSFLPREEFRKICFDADNLTPQFQLPRSKNFLVASRTAPTSRFHFEAKPAKSKKLPRQLLTQGSRTVSSRERFGSKSAVKIEFGPPSKRAETRHRVSAFFDFY
ncbi:MAG: hypothetical protein LBJ64_07640, partial [Deltaproteobacteria bacterium]|nr:hypothetical protein [Deltaproteobacteria bacterium]